MSESPFTYWLAQIMGYGFFFGMFVMGTAFIEEVVGVVTPYEPVILRTLEADNRSH